MIKDIGSWPITTPGLEWSENNWQLEKTLATVRKNYAHAAFMLYVSEDDRNNTFNRLIVRENNRRIVCQSIQSICSSIKQQVSSQMQRFSTDQEQN